MMHKTRKLSTAFVVVTVLSLCSCFNNDYDLSDIDTNVRVQAKDLVIPINMSPITLERVLDIDDSEPDAKIRRVNGEYAVVKEGRFSSSNININPFRIARLKDVTATAFMPVTEEFKEADLPNWNVVTKEHYKTDRKLIASKVTSDTVNMDFHASNVDAAIEHIDAIETEPFEVNVSVTVSGLDQFVTTYDFENLVLHLPKGLKLTEHEGEYNPKTGLLSFNETVILEEGKPRNFRFIVEGIDVSVSDATLKDQMFSYNFDCYATGIVTIYPHNLLEVVNPTKLYETEGVGYTLVANMKDDVVIKTFSGTVNYEVDDINVSPVDLSDLPDFFRDSESQIGLVNPQIYLSLTNPIQQGVVLTANAELIPSPDNVDGKSFTFDVAAEKEQNAFCYSPQKPATYYTGWENAEFKEFANFTDILKSKGKNGMQVPDFINIEVNAGVKQKLTNFKLGKYDKVEGAYTFFAPLQLSDGSFFVYTDTIDGWSDDDLDKLTITSLDIMAKVNSEVPVDVTCDIIPIDKKGKKIEGVTVKDARIPAHANNHDFHAVVTGEIKKIDGIILKARADAKDGKALGPDMKITLIDTKVKASGYYEDEL